MNERRATLGLSPALPGIVLVVVIVWALAAVLMLTGTLVNAREIENTIPIINSQVSPIDKDLDNVKLAAKTAKISGKILVAAKNLSAEADRIISVARSIDGHVDAINQTAAAINDTVKSINETAKSINRTVSAINGNVESIHRSVASIGSSVASIHRTVAEIGSRVTSIHTRVATVFNAVGGTDATNRSISGSVGRIRRTFVALDPVTKSIDSGVAAINGRADKGIDGVAGLHADLLPVSVLVGPAGPDHSSAGVGTIHAHANAIDCSGLINLLGPTAYCGK